MSWCRPNLYSGGVEVDWANPVNHSLAAMFLFNEKNYALTYDTARLVIPATLKSGSITPVVPTRVSGPHGPAMYFTATYYQYADIAAVGPNVQMSPLGLTCVFWLNHASNQLGVMYGESRQDDFITFDCNITAAGKGQCSVVYTGAWPTVATNTTLATNTWYHLAFSVGPRGQFAYVNGALDNTNANTHTNFGLITGSAHCTIGSYSNRASFNAAPFDGAIESLMLWKRQLADQEVAELCGTPYHNVASSNGLPCWLR